MIILFILLDLKILLFNLCTSGMASVLSNKRARRNLKEKTLSFIVKNVFVSSDSEQFLFCSKKSYEWIYLAFVIFLFCLKTRRMGKFCASTLPIDTWWHSFHHLFLCYRSHKLAIASRLREWKVSIRKLNANSIELKRIRNINKYQLACLHWVYYYFCMQYAVHVAMHITFF